jgi:thermosome
MAARVVAEAVKSALGPMGMDKMLVDTLGDVTITSDGATILKEMDIEHPAAKMMVEVAKTTDDEVADGTTSVVVLAGRLLEKAEALLDQNVHATIIVDGYQAATAQALQYYAEIAIPVAATDRDVLHKVAKTTIASKMIATDKAYLAQLAVDAVLKVATQRDEAYHVDLDDVKVETKIGASLAETRLIDGVVLDKEVVHAGMPTRIDDARIALLNCPLEIEKTEITAKINIENPNEMQAFLDEEERMLKGIVEQITAAGANVVIGQKGIDDLVQHFLAKAGILAVRRASSSNIETLAKATGGKIVVNVAGLTSSDLGYAQLVEERKIGDDDWIFVEGCKNPKAVTILIRGGTDKVVDEAERSIHDALCVVRDVLHRPLVVAGGGAPEIEVASRLKKWAESLSGKEQLAALGFADALEVIPVTRRHHRRRCPRHGGPRRLRAAGREGAGPDLGERGHVDAPPHRRRHRLGEDDGSRTAHASRRTGRRRVRVRVAADPLSPYFSLVLGVHGERLLATRTFNTGRRIPELRPSGTRLIIRMRNGDRCVTRRSSLRSRVNVFERSLRDTFICTSHLGRIKNE